MYLAVKKPTIHIGGNNMKMADKKIGNIGIYERYGLEKMAFGEYMRIGCDTGVHLLTTKKWVVMMEHCTFTKIVEYCIVGNIRYFWWWLTKRGN